MTLNHPLHHQDDRPDDAIYLKPPTKRDVIEWTLLGQEYWLDKEGQQLRVGDHSPSLQPSPMFTPPQQSLETISQLDQEPTLEEKTLCLKLNPLEHLQLG